jgi:ABC-type Fe3+ transport system substrate-binding protein
VFSAKLPSVNHTTTHLAYNTKLVKKADVPKRYEDLLDPKWKGRIAVDGRGPYGFSHLRLVWGEERFWKFIKAFPEQKPIWDTRCSGSTDRVHRLRIVPERGGVERKSGSHRIPAAGPGLCAR